MQPVALDIFNIVALLGAIQGFLLAGVLATKRRNRTANRLLAVAIFAFSVQMISVVYQSAGWYRVFPHFFGIAYPLALLYGPLIYLYSVTASDRARRLRRWDSIHFAPFVVVVLTGLPIYLMSGPEKIEFYHQMMAGQRTTYVIVIDGVKYISGISYAVVTILFLLRHRVRVKDSYSSTERVNLQWLLHLAAAGAVIWIGAILFHFTEVTTQSIIERQDDIIALAIAVLVYAIGYVALRQPEVFNIATGEFPTVARPDPDSLPPTKDIRASVTPPPELESAPRYERSGLGEGEAVALKKELLQTMEERHPYRNSDLTLPDLAGQLGTTPHKLSEVLNAQLNQNFYDFVNGFRVREVQLRLADEKSQALTLLSLALDAGFASKSTFNSVFKKHTGQTPSGYRRSLGFEKAPEASNS